ncbi:MAG TPA: hypothetical protein VGN16_19335 [Acidobacteriaceae bacterium]|jgi:ppGpp synthetase/RelA/SpoT-type nucleotidyltranferase
MAKPSHGKIIAEYDQLLPVNELFRQSMERLIGEVLTSAGHHVHSVTSRVKSRDHLESKIARLGKNYANLSEVTDVVGVRITTYFEDEVDAIGKLLESEFQIDSKNSVDKRASLDPDRFGYLSLHYVCSMSPNRAVLTENHRFDGLKFEVQVRSILQHAWAEIEHDLGYKAGIAIPAVIRRRFSRLAGLLEIADIEFTRLRNDLDDYSRKVAEEIGTNSEHLDLNKVSLERFITDDPLVIATDRCLVAAMPEVTLNETEVVSLSPLVQMLLRVGFKTIGDLRRGLRQYGERIVAQYPKTIEESPSIDDSHIFYRGLSVFGLFLFTLTDKSMNLSELIAALEESKVESEAIRRKLANKLWTFRR